MTNLTPNFTEGYNAGPIGVANVGSVQDLAMAANGDLLVADMYTVRRFYNSSKRHSRTQLDCVTIKVTLLVCVVLCCVLCCAVGYIVSVRCVVLWCVVCCAAVCRVFCSVLPFVELRAACCVLRVVLRCVVLCVV